MKDFKELDEFRVQLQEKKKAAEQHEIRIVVGMATCGIAAGAQPVYDAFVKEIENRKLENVKVVKSGCVGVCRFEPLAEIYVPGQEKVTYVHLTPARAAEIVANHIVNNQIVYDYTIGAYLGGKQ